MQCGSARVEVHLVRLGQLACRIHQSRRGNRNHHLVCVRHHLYIRIHHLFCVRHLFYIRNHPFYIRNRLLVQHSTQPLGQRLDRLGQRLDRLVQRLELHGRTPDRLERTPVLPRRLDPTMQIELELGFGKQISSQQLRINKFVIEVALKILFHSRENIRRKSVLRRSRLPLNTILSLLRVITTNSSC